MFILVTVGVVVGVAVLTSGLLERRYSVHMRAPTAEGLTQDTRVYLQGLHIGRVQQVNPTVDSTTNTLRFVVRLAIQDRFPDGTPIRLPAGTRGVITQPNPVVGAPLIQLELPAAGDRGFLQPGDTIESSRVQTVVDVLGGVATQLAEELGATLDQTRQLVARAARTIDQSNALLTTSRPQVRDLFQQLAHNLQRTERILTRLEPQVGGMADTLMSTLVLTQRVMHRFDSLSATAYAMTTENRDAITEIVRHLNRSAVILENFADRLSRRPLRFLTGVTPPPPDTSGSQP